MPFVRRLFAALALASLLSPSIAHAAWPPNGTVVHSGPGTQGLWGPIVPDGTGGVIVPWVDGVGSPRDLFALKMLASGGPDPAWPAAGTALSTAVRSQSLIWSCADGTGGAYMVWQDTRDSATTKIDIYGIRVRANGSVAPGWPADGLALCNATGDQRLPICAPTADGIVVGWYDFRVINRTDIEAQRVDSLGVIRWAANGVPVSTGIGLSSISFFPPMTVLGDGIFVWGDFRGGSGDVYVQSLDANGQPPVFLPDGGPVCTNLDPQQLPQAVLSGGAVYFVWEDQRGGAADIYGERLDATTLALWNSPSGVPICTAAGNQFSPQVIADGSGGAIYAWQDFRNGDSDLYTQHLTSTGAIATGSWVADGIPVAQQPAQQGLIQLLADGSGGAYVAWNDDRNGPDLTFAATRITGAGSVVAGWPATGQVAFAGPLSGRGRACLDGSDGIYMAWSDSRLDPLDPDLYLHRIGPDGGAPTVDVPVSPRTSLLAFAAAPNPSRGPIVFSFELPAAGRVDLDVFDVRGRLVESLVPGILPAGPNRLTWNRRRSTGEPAIAGIYLARLHTPAGESRVQVVTLP